MNAALTKQDRIPFLIICLYAVAELLPGSNTADVMGNQWFFFSIVNLISILYIAFSKNTFITEAISRIARTALFLVYLFLFLLVALSVTWSINQTEGLVGISRWTNMFIMFSSIAILLYGRSHLIKWLAWLFSALLLIQCFMIVTQFFKGVDEGAEIDKLIYSIKLNTGNKNIVAAGLLMKIPFLLYLIFSSSAWKRIVFAAVLLLAALSVFILNARAAYIGLSLELLLFIILTFVLNYKNNRQESIFKISVTAIPVVIAFFLSSMLIKSSANENETTAPYGTVAERLSSISLTSEGSNSRLQQWSTAIDYLKAHPIKGCGVSNWKLASIPYEKTFVNDFLVTYHVHNDYLEVTTETGWLGGLLYLSLFFILFLYLLKAVTRSPGASQPIVIIALPLLFAYACDAFFNFPLERPVMQFYFALLMGIVTSMHLLNRKNNSVSRSNTGKFIFLAFAMILLIPTTYINYQTYRSLIAQSMVNKDIMNPTPEAKTEDVMKAFPSIPNMNAYCFPFGNIKAIYLLRDKKYDEALGWLNKTRSVNPSLTLDEFLRARIYFESNKLDSADHYIRIAFAGKPRSKSTYEMLNTISAARKDTSMLLPAFYQYIHYRPEEPSEWNVFLVNGFNLQMNRRNLLRIADSAITIFPNNAELANTRQAIFNAVNDTVSKKNTAVITNKNDDPEFREQFDAAMAAFGKNDFKTALQYFSKAAQLNPDQYLCTENIGVCYYSLASYEKAMGYFDQVIRSKRSNDGKSEFFKAACLISLNRKDEACPLLHAADKKHYSQAPQLIANYCQ